MRIRISKENEEAISDLKLLYNFKSDGVVPRIALSFSLFSGKLFSIEKEIIPSSDGKEFRDEKALFGSIIGDGSNFIIYKTIIDQHYHKSTFEDEFAKLFKLHLNHGLLLWNEKIKSSDITVNGHIDIILKAIKSGLSLRSSIISTNSNKYENNLYNEFNSLLTLILGKNEDGEDIDIRINDLREFDNRNIAIAGMAGSGKTQLVKDILFQISKQTNNNLKFIYFDYKGEGKSVQLKPFLDSTNCDFVDIIEDSGIKFNPLSSINVNKKQQLFSIKSFVDTIATFIPSIGVAQKNILLNIIIELFDESKSSFPTIAELFSKTERFYIENNRTPDTLFAGIQDLSTNIFDCSPNNTNILDKSIYLNLPPTLSDTLRQLIVFLLLRYFNTYFSLSNDCEPKDFIFPLRYVIVIDEAHIYLKNKNARKALEDLLRLMRSKGVIIMLLSQGVDDYKTKDFDFASQVKLPICLNVQNKDYKSISGFLGTPHSKFKLESVIKKLESGKGLVSFGDPEIIELRQWWKTIKEENLNN